MRQGIRSKRRGKPGLAPVIVVLFVLCLAALAYYFVSENMVFTAEGFTIGKKPEQPVAPEIGGDKPQINIEGGTPPVEPEVPGVAVDQPKEALALQFVSAQNMADTAFVQGLIDSGVKQVAFIVKDKSGILNLPLATQLTVKVDPMAEKRSENLALLTKNNVHTVAYVAAMRDAVMPRAYRAEAVCVSGGQTWIDSENISWFKPDSAVLKQYIMEIGADLAARGVAEMVLTDVSYPSIGKRNLIANAPVSEQIVTDFVSGIQVEGVGIAFEVSSVLDTAITGQNVANLSQAVSHIYLNDMPQSEAELWAKPGADYNKFVYSSTSLDDSLGVNYVYGR